MSLLCVLNAAKTRIQAAQRGRIARRSAAPHRESAPWAPATPPKPLAADTSPSLASVLGGCNPQAALAPLGSLHVFGGAPSAGSGILPPPVLPPPPAPPPVQHNLAPPAKAPPPIQIPGFHASTPPMTRALSDGCVPSPHTAYHARARALAEPHHHHHHHHRAPSFPHNVYNSQPSTPEQHREQLPTAIVIDRLCAWGEHRAASEWPAGLVGPGPMPALVDALLATRARLLTLSQLITAIKERTGGGPAGRALDMLNLKAYVRCFPSLFYLHSGRTAAGRPLDAVELRPCAGLPPLLLSPPGLAMTRAERHRVAVGIATSAWSPANGGAGGGRPHPHHHHQPCAPVPPSCANTLYDRLQPVSAHGQPVSPLQPKDLFGAAASPRAGFAPCAAPAPALSLGERGGKGRGGKAERKGKGEAQRPPCPPSPHTPPCAPPPDASTALPAGWRGRIAREGPRAQGLGDAASHRRRRRPAGQQRRLLGPQG